MRKNFLIPILVLGIAFVAVLCFLIQGSGKLTNLKSDSKIKVAASFFPVYDIVRQIGGDKISIVRVLPAGASPHTFEITPEKIKESQGVKTIFKVGGIDDWTDGLAESIGAKKVVLSEGITIKNYAVAIIGEKEEEGNGDPHYWMTMNNAKIMAATVARELSAIDPKNSAYFYDNLSSFGKEADNADREIRSVLAPYKDRSIVAFHNAWNYFAEEYGLSIAASFEPAPGQEPSPRYLKELSDIVKNKGIKVIFAEPAFSTDSIKSFTSDLGLKLFVLYPEDGPNPQSTLIDTMVYNAKVIAKTLSE